MSREKQIEEMKLIIDKAEEEYSELWNEWFYDHKEGTKIDHEFLFFAKLLYDAGYRKASEVARGIFEEIYERLLQSFPPASFIDAPCTTHDRIFDMIAELKKKYTEEGK